MDVQVNWVAVFAGAVSTMVVGFIWYSKPLFANQWMKLSGLSASDVKNGPGIGYALTFVASLLMCYVLAHFQGLMEIVGWMDGATTGFWAGLGFAATAFASDSIFNRKPLNLFLITAGYQVVAITVAGGVVAALS